MPVLCPPSAVFFVIRAEKAVNSIKRVLNMSAVIPFNFNSHSVRVLTGDDGEPWFVAKDVAEILGYARSRDAVAQHCKGAVKHRLLTGGGIQDVQIIPERDLYRLVMRSKLPAAEAFEDWVVGEVLPSIRKTGSYQAPPVARPMTELDVAEAAARMLRMSETSKIRMLSSVCEGKGLSAGFLPGYVDEGRTQSLSELLKEHNVDMSSRAFNVILMDLGMLEELQRKSTGGGMKSFKSITDKGLHYGKNETSPKCPSQAQPRYFSKAFPELLDLVNQYLRSDNLEIAS